MTKQEAYDIIADLVDNTMWNYTLTKYARNDEEALASRRAYANAVWQALGMVKEAMGAGVRNESL